jgi:HEAT repeat protein
MRVCIGIVMALLVGSVAAQEPTFAGKPLGFWLDRLKDKNVAHRLEAAGVLEELAAPASVPALVEAFADPDDFVRIRASGAIQRIGAAALPKLLAATKSENLTVRRHAVLSTSVLLKDDPGEETTKALLGLLNDKDIIVRSFAIRALGKSKPQLVAGPLLKLLQAEETLVRQYAIQTLGDLEVKEAVAPLAAFLKDVNPHLRRAAAESLGNLVGHLNPALPALTAGLVDEDAEVRQRVVQTLAKVKPPSEALARLLVGTLGDKDQLVREQGMRALAEMEVAIPALRDALKGKDAAIRQRVVQVLGSLGVPAVEALRVALKDELFEVRMETLRSLVDIGKPAIVPALGDALGDSRVEIRRAAARVLGQLGRNAKAAVPALTGALKDKDDEVLGSVALTLAQIGPDARAALEALRGVKSENPNVRRAVEEAIKRIEP